MNAHIHHPKVPHCLAAAALAVATLAPLGAQELNRTRAQAGQEVYWIAKNDVDDRRIDRLLGREIRGEDGKRIATLKDFIVDVQSGQAVLAVVSVGGVLGVGDTLRLVPLRALGHLPGAKDPFLAPVTAAHWQSMPALESAHFDKGTVPLTVEHRRTLIDYDTRLGTDPPLVFDERDAAANRLLRASLFRNKPVHARGEKIGEVEDVVVDFGTGAASVVLDADKALTGVDQDFIVPVSRLEFGVWEKTIATNLTREDFRQARRVEPTVAVRERTRTARDVDVRERERAVRDVEARERVAASPTGRTEVPERRAARVDDPLDSAARAIREYWSKQPELAKLNLGVTVEADRLVLRGTVPTEKLWERAKDSAESLVSGIKIDNRIAIRPR